MSRYMYFDKIKLILDLNAFERIMVKNDTIQFYYRSLGGKKIYPDYDIVYDSHDEAVEVLLKINEVLMDADNIKKLKERIVELEYKPPTQYETAAKSFEGFVKSN